jgi:DHA1 family bicyclomycin/chloramphenicol resistance-like MFS transporter
MAAPDPAAAAAASRARRAVPGPLAAAALLALLLGMQPATTDIYLPALPALTRALGAPVATAQLTMSALILAFGLGQLFWGPVADRFGRRPALLASIGLYATASAAAAAAPGIDWLILCRIAQGLTMAGAIVCARAIVRDLFAPTEGAQVMALAMSGLGAVAVSGPALGGWVAEMAGWRAVLAVVTGYGLVALAVIAWRLPETLAQRDHHATRWRPIRANWVAALRHPTFLAWTLLAACSYGGVFTFLAGSSFVFIEVLGLSPAQCGLAMATVSGSYLVATFVCRRWIRRFGLVGSVQRGAVFSALAALAFAAVGVLDLRAVAWVLGPQWVYAFGHGFHMPCGQTGAVAPFPRMAGAASALAGFVLALVAFGVGRWLGVALDGSVRPFAFGLAFWAAATAFVAWTLVRRHGHPAA